MNGLDSPSEALVLNYLSYGVVSVIINNIWTWIAVLTAGAVSSFLINARANNKNDSYNNNSCTRDCPISDPVFICSCTSDSSKKFLSSSTTITTANQIISSTAEFVERKTIITFIPTEKIAERLFSDTRATESGGGVTRGKFHVVYYNDQEEEEDERENVRESEEREERDDVSLVNGNGELERWRWRERIGEWKMGWYRYQDLTVLDGNIVRLWEGNGKIIDTFI